MSQEIERVAIQRKLKNMATSVVDAAHEYFEKHGCICASDTCEISGVPAYLTIRAEPIPPKTEELATA